MLITLVMAKYSSVINIIGICIWEISQQSYVCLAKHFFTKLPHTYLTKFLANINILPHNQIALDFRKVIDLVFSKLHLIIFSYYYSYSSNIINFLNLPLSKNFLNTLLPILFLSGYSVVTVLITDKKITSSPGWIYAY